MPGFFHRKAGRNLFCSPTRGGSLRPHKAQLRRELCCLSARGWLNTKTLKGNLALRTILGWVWFPLSDFCVGCCAELELPLACVALGVDTKHRHLRLRETTNVRQADGARIIGGRLGGLRRNRAGQNDTCSTCPTGRPACNSFPWANRATWRTRGARARSARVQMGTYDVTAAQYAQFLNAVATTSDPYGLYNSSMARWWRRRQLRLRDRPERRRRQLHLFGCHGLPELPRELRHVGRCGPFLQLAAKRSADQRHRKATARPKRDPTR